MPPEDDSEVAKIFHVEKYLMFDHVSPWQRQQLEASLEQH